MTTRVSAQTRARRKPTARFRQGQLSRTGTETRSRLGRFFSPGDRGSLPEHGRDARGDEPRHQEGPHSARQDGDNAVHGGQHTHSRIVRAGGQDSERGRDQRVRLGQQRGEGRVAVQHSADPPGDERGHHRYPAQSLGRAPLPGEKPGRLRNKRGRRDSRASHPDAAGYVHDARDTSGAWRA